MLHLRFCSSVKLNEISKFWALNNCTKMRLAARLRPDPLGSYSAPPDPLAVIRGGEVRGGEGREGKRREGERRGGRAGEGKEGEGKGRKGEGKERGREGHSNPPPKVWLRACKACWAAACATICLCPSKIYNLHF